MEGKEAEGKEMKKEEVEEDAKRCEDGRKISMERRVAEMKGGRR